ncbi:MAG: ABC transporter permease [Chloroflexi bacterium]|nr:ABC transporter permease [Chloroflexota bacterium]
MNEKQKITVYSSETSNRLVVDHLRQIVNDLPRAHELGLRLFKRNVKALYRQSLLGFAWALIPPLATAILWILLRGNNIVQMNDTGTPYPVFVLTGTLLWQLFSEAISAPLNQVTENKAMLAKINIPREGLLLSGAYHVIFNTAIKVVLLSVIYAYFRQTITLTSLAFLPVGLLSIGMAGFSIGLALTPLGMLYQDINKGLAVLLPFFMYLTPVVYPAPREGIMGLLMRANPLATLINETRNWLTLQPVQDMPYFIGYTMAFVVLFLLSLVVYHLSMPMIIERIGS